MATTINWGSKVITVPRADMELIQLAPTEIRQLPLNDFRLDLKDLEGDSDGMSFLQTHDHNTEVSVGGVTLARVINMINGYTVTFEDGQYAVNLNGANSNVGDVVNVNQVSVRSANSAGLIASQAIEYGEYGGQVTIDTIRGVSGTTYPIGTQRKPVNNIQDAVTIANLKGFSVLFISQSMSVVAGDDISHFALHGPSHVTTAITIEAGAECHSTHFSYLDITGVLDGGSEIDDCIVRDIQYFNGHIHNCSLVGTITLEGNADALIKNCTLLDFDNLPVLDCGGSGQDAMIPGWAGKLKVVNLTGMNRVGVGLAQGVVEVDASCTAGVIQVSGTGDVVDNSAGAMVDQRAMISLGNIATSVWDEIL